ncbi:hypothetical protein Btru_064514 [Bulinus truncatus]|nr:hypothetical protein Btru_064514 [Bulinus truncatus]
MVSFMISLMVNVKVSLMVSLMVNVKVSLMVSLMVSPLFSFMVSPLFSFMVSPLVSFMVSPLVSFMVSPLSQRNKLWAHARNKTTEKQLLGKLQHLEHDYDRSYRHYIRNRTRLQSELNELRRLNDDLDIVNKEKRTTSSTHFHKAAHVDRSSQSQVVISLHGQRHQDNQPSKYLPVTSENILLNWDNQIRDKLTCMSDVLRSSTVGDIESTKFTNSLRDHQTRPATWDELRVSQIKCSPYGSTCRYKEGMKADAVCQHFPCQLPMTYHTLGYRRDDVTPWGSDDVTDNDSARTLSCKKSILTQSDNVGDFLPTDTISSPKLRQLQSFPASNSRLAANYQRIGQPLFRPKPPDLILEQIRCGSLEPMPEVPCMTRKTVRAKIRGLKQLVLEMRERNDLIKPLDWAVNYGTRLPTRVLLNPAFPV